MAYTDIIESLPPDLRRPVGQLVDALRDEFRVQRIEFEELKGVVRELAEAQKRTEQRLERLETVVEELAQAQKRTEQRVEELAEAQKHTDDAVSELARAQKRTEVALRALARQVGGLSDTVGGDIEDIAYIVLHDVLRREYGWAVGPLERTWQRWNGEPEEVNIFGTATDPAQPSRQIWIVGEAKHNLTESEARRFVQQAERARLHLVGEMFPVCFCYRLRPEVQELLKEAGIRLVFSYGKLV